MSYKKTDILITINEAAQLLKVSKYTIKRYLNSGQLKGIRLPSSHWRVLENSCMELITNVSTKELDK